jgi:hypothetical protein
MQVAREHGEDGGASTPLFLHRKPGFANLFICIVAPVAAPSETSPFFLSNRMTVMMLILECVVVFAYIIETCLPFVSIMICFLIRFSVLLIIGTTNIF